MKTHSLDIPRRHPCVDEGIRTDKRIRDAMSQHLKEHPTCARCGCNTHLQVHHIAPLWLHVELSWEDQIMHASDPLNMITLCEHPEDGNDHLIWGHDGSFASRCVPNVRELLRARQVIKRADL